MNKDFDLYLILVIIVVFFMVGLFSVAITRQGIDNYCQNSNSYESCYNYCETKKIFDCKEIVFENYIDGNIFKLLDERK